MNEITSSHASPMLKSATDVLKNDPEIPKMIIRSATIIILAIIIKYDNLKVTFPPVQIDLKKECVK